MSQFFEPERKKRWPTKKGHNRKAMGRSFAEIEKKLNGLPFDPDRIYGRARTIIENNAIKRKNLK